MPSNPSFCRLARHYELLESLAFGPCLHRARTAWIDRLAGAGSILLLGDGNGRFLSDLVRANRGARIVSIDSSPAMLDRARQRIRQSDVRAFDRIEWRCADLLDIPLPAGSFDAVVAHFFLDCFTEIEVTRILAKVNASLTSRGRWFWSDFVIPEAGPGRIIAPTVVRLLYLFFRGQTGLHARELPPLDRLRGTAGLRVTHTRSLLCGILRSSIWDRTD
ncbi:MAG: methyltransferase domain-containing protein [Opitutaceae bacterium]